MYENTISFTENFLQDRLFPLFEFQIKDELLDCHMKVVRALEYARIEDLMPSKVPFTRGRPPKHFYKVARAFIAKHVLNMVSTDSLIERLKFDKNLRYICGWAPHESVASPATFSRIFNMLATYQIPQKIHKRLIKKVFEGHAVIHNGRDSTAIPARESSEKTRKPTIKKRGPKYKAKGWENTLKGRQILQNLSVDEMIEELPNKSDHGRKQGTKGSTECWRGYKAHLDVAEGSIPMSFILTSASTNDCEVAIPLSKMTSERSEVFYELMDSAYDSAAIEDYIIEAGRVPLIKRQKRGKAPKAALEQEERARKVLKFRPAEAVRLSKRYADERIFARLKDGFSTTMIWVKGYWKVACLVALSVFCLTVDELARKIE